jgi:hypothetical protein
VAAPPKIAAYDRSCAGIADSNPAGERYLSLVSVVFCQVEMFVTSPNECYVSECARGTSQARDRSDRVLEP